MSSLEGGPEGPEEPWDRQAWLYEHFLKQVDGHGDTARVRRCGNDFGDSLALDTVLARKHELSERHQT